MKSSSQTNRFRWCYPTTW